MRQSFRLPPDAATDADPNTTLEPRGELAELSHLIRVHHPLPDVRAPADGLFGFCWDETRGGALFADLVRGEPQATYPVELYGVFAQAGCGTRRWRRCWRPRPGCGSGGSPARTTPVPSAS